MSRAAFHEVCAGATGASIITALADAEHSRRRLLMRALADTPATGGVFADPEPAWAVLVAAERRAPDVVRDLILYPPFGVWLRRALVRLRGSGQSGLTELGYLNTVAAAAAIRTGVPCFLTLPVRHGTIVLPTVGRVQLPTSFPVGTALLRHSVAGTRITALDGRVSIDVDPERADDVFRPIPAHAVRAGGFELSIRLDDTDPYREFADPLPPHETGPTELLEWRKRLDETWHLLVHRHPGWAAELAAGLRVVTPVGPDQTLGGFSSAAAIGAVAAAGGLPTVRLAEALVHEFQHSMVNAVSRLVDLTTTDAGHYYAPWRPDPRGPGAMLHGLYAFVAVAEFWLVHRDDGDRLATTAELLFAYRREQIRWALDSLTGVTGGLTEAGHELVAGVRQRLAATESAPTAQELQATVHRMVADHYADWRLRNIRPDSAAVAALVDDWRHRRPATPPSPGTVAGRRSQASARPDRGALSRVRITDPAGFAGFSRAAERSGDPAFRADIAYCRDDWADAMTLYRNLWERDGAVDALVGIGLCLHAAGRPGAARALLCRPEVTAAVCARLGPGTNPVLVADWLSPAIGTSRVGAP